MSAMSSNSPFMWVAARWAEKMQDQWAVFIDGYYVRIGKDRDQYFVLRFGSRAEDIDPNATVLIRRRRKSDDYEKDWRSHEAR